LFATQVHDRDSIFSRQLDTSVKQMHVAILRTPVRAPKANSICERFGGILRRECLDFVIPLNESHLRLTVTNWQMHYNHGRPHSSLGPGLPEPTQDKVPAGNSRHKLPAGYGIEKISLLDGLHHEYRLVKEGRLTTSFLFAEDGGTASCRCNAPTIIAWCKLHSDSQGCEEIGFGTECAHKYAIVFAEIFCHSLDRATL
jgi:hypothetical protein